MTLSRLDNISSYETALDQIKLHLGANKLLTGLIWVIYRRNLGSGLGPFLHPWLRIVCNDWHQSINACSVQISSHGAHHRQVCVVLPERKFGNALLSAKSFLGNHLKSSPTHSSFISFSRTISHKRLYYPLCAKESLLQTQTMKYSFNLISYFPASVLPTATI